MNYVDRYILLKQKLEEEAKSAVQKTGTTTKTATTGSTARGGSSNQTSKLPNKILNFYPEEMIAPLYSQIVSRQTVEPDSSSELMQNAFERKMPNAFDDGNYLFPSAALADRGGGKNVFGNSVQPNLIFQGSWNQEIAPDPYDRYSQSQLRELIDSEKNPSKKLAYVQTYNNKHFAASLNTLSQNKMDGTGVSILDYMRETAQMSSGKEKRGRVENIKKKMAELGIDPSDYGIFSRDGNFELGTFAKFLGAAGASGLTSFSSSIANTADVILGAPLKAAGWENNPVSQWADFESNTYEANRYTRDLYAKKLGGGAGYGVAGDVVEGTVGALPNAILAFMTSGTSLLGQTAATGGTLATQAAYRAGNILTKAGMNVSAMMKNPQYWLSFAQTYGNDYKEARQMGASDEVAALGATVTSLINSGIEIGIDGMSGIQGLPTELAEEGGNALLKWLVSSAEEGGEEVLQKFVKEAVTKVAYDRDADILNPKEYAKEAALGTAVGMALGGGQYAAKGAVNAVNTQIENRLTANEKAVVNKIIDDKIAEKGGKISANEKADIRKKVLRDLEKGYIPIDTIEEVLGGETYKTYKEYAGQETRLRNEYEAAQKEYQALYEMKNGEKSDAQIDRQAELKKKLETLKEAINKVENDENRNSLKAKLTDDVFAIAQNDRLAESYNEKTRRGQAFKADLSQYNEKQRAVVQKAMGSGILNNTNRTHEFVDFISRVSADKDVPFVFTNNEKLKNSGFAVEGKQVNGLFTKDGIMLNIDSAKSMNAVVGHEIMHVMKGTEFYDPLKEKLFDIAKAKGEYQSRYDSLAELYRDIKDADIEDELTADLVGDYLFSDPDFINNLSTQNRNVFQKIFDEIKYLCKVVTAGSKEARELEKVKKAFEEAYREGGKTQTETKYSVSETTDGRFAAVVDSDILSNIDTSSWDKETKKAAKRAANEALKQFSDGIEVSDIRLEVSKTTRDEYTRSAYSEMLARKNPAAYGDKMRASANIGDVVHVATDWARDGVLQHDRNDFADFARGKTLIMSGDRAYNAEVVVGIRANGEAVLYDVVDINPDSFEIKKAEPSTAVSTNELSNAIQEGSAGDKLAQNSDSVKSSVPGTDGDPVITEQQNERGQDAVSNDMDIAPVRSLSNDGQQHTPDSLSALRLEAPVYSEADTTFDAPVAEQLELPYGAPIAEAYTVGAKNATTTTEQTASKITGDDIAPLIDSKFDAPTAEYLAEVAKKETIAKNTEIAVLRQAAENTAALDLSEKEQNSLGIFREKLEKLDSLQAKYEEIRGKEGMFTADDLDAISRYQKQIDVLHNNLWEYSQNPILKTVSQKAREILREQYGTIPAGENPVRAAALPAKTNKTNRVSKTASTAIEAGVTTDAVAEQIRQKAVEGEYSYLPITDESAKQRADETIRRKGWDDTLTDWRANMRNSAFPGKDMVTLGFQLYNNAVNAGDTKTALHILTDITNTVRNSAQVVQAVRILKQLSPDDRLYAIRRQLDTIQDDLNKRYGDKAPKIDMNSALAENYLNAQGEEAIRAAEDALFRDIAEQLPNTFADKWNSWRYLSMLGNIRTHVRNVLGNVGFAPVRSIKDLIAYGMEAGVNAISPDGIARTKGKLFVHREADRALYSAGLKDYHTAENLIGSANLKSGDAISRIEQMQPAFGGDKAIWRVLSKVAEMNSNALSSEDMIFKKTTYASAFGGYLKANGITVDMIQTGKVSDSVLDKARVYAFDEALKATYNDFNDFSNFVAKLGNLRSSENKAVKTAGLLVEGVLPFKRTPANIVARSVEYSPVGMLKGIKQCLFDVRSGKVTAAEAIDSVASGLTGSILLGFGALLANMGLVSGGDDEDEKQRQFDKLRGEQSYALKAFGKSYTIDWLAPEVIPMFIGVELYERMNRSGELRFKDILDSIARVSNPLLEMSCLSSLNDLLDSISYSDNKLYSVFSQAAASYVLQALPTVFGQIERIGEPYREQTYLSDDSQLPKDMQQTIAKAANKIPGVEYRQIPYIDAYGRRQETGGIGTRVFSNMLSPGYFGTDRSAPWDDELQRLYDIGYSSVLPSTAAKKIGDKVLSAEEYVQYATFTGKERYRLLGEVTESDYYRKSSDADKEAILQDLYSYVNAEGSKKMLPDREVAKWTEKAMEMEKIGVPFAEFLRMKNTAVNENGNFTKDTCVAYIKKNFPASKRKAIWDIMKNPSWNDAW